MLQAHEIKRQKNKLKKSGLGDVIDARLVGTVALYIIAVPGKFSTAASQCVLRARLAGLWKLTQGCWSLAVRCWLDENKETRALVRLLLCFRLLEGRV